MANITKVSPLAPKGGMPQLPAIEGVRFSAAAAGVKYQGRDDVMLAEIGPGSAIAGVFTKSATRSANVLDCQRKLGQTDDNAGFAFVVNSGNSNAFTGREGDNSVARICAKAGETLGIPTSNVFTSSTGVIGERLPDDRITAVIDNLAKTLAADTLDQAAHAIMTTDTYPKAATITSGGVTLAGIAKGSGMIAPDMATMLVYIFTDAKDRTGRLASIGLPN